MKRFEQRVEGRLIVLQGNVRLLIDAEHSYMQAAIDAVVIHLQQKYNRQTPVVFNTYQCYLKDSHARVMADMQLAKEKGFLLAAKVVRGAYIHLERERSAELGYPSPIHDTLEDTHHNYNRFAPPSSACVAVATIKDVAWSICGSCSVSAYLAQVAAAYETVLPVDTSAGTLAATTMLARMAQQCTFVQVLQQSEHQPTRHHDLLICLLRKQQCNLLHMQASPCQTQDMLNCCVCCNNILHAFKGDGWLLNLHVFKGDGWLLSLHVCKGDGWLLILQVFKGDGKCADSPKYSVF